jgi:hypothetical protein
MGRRYLRDQLGEKDEIESNNDSWSNC